MGFILMALSSGLEKRKSWVGNSCFYFAISQSLVLEKTILHLPSVHILPTWILHEDWPCCITVMILRRTQGSFSFWHWEPAIFTMHKHQNNILKEHIWKWSLAKYHINKNYFSFSVSEFLLAFCLLWQLGTELYPTFPQSEAPQKLRISGPGIWIILGYP